MAISNPNTQNTEQTPGQPRQVGTGFTNLQTIMGANQGNKLGQAVAGGIKQTGQQTTNALQQGQQDFNTQSQKNALGTQDQQQDVQNTLGNLGVGPDGKPISNSANITDPSSTDVSNFSKYMSGQYNGPKHISNISGIQNQAQNAEQQGKAVSTAGGRQALLQQYAAKPGSTYGSGAQNLDTTILGATGGNQLQQARQSVSGLNNQVNSAQAAAQQQAQQLQNQAQGFGQQVTGQVTGAKNFIYGNAQNQADKDNAAQNAGYKSFQDAVQAAQSGTISSDAANALGLTNGQTLYGVNLGQYLGYNQNGQAITDPSQLQKANALNEMGQPQYQQYSGLNKLLGTTPEAQQQQFQAGKNTYDTTGLNTTLATPPQDLTDARNSYRQAQDMMALFGPNVSHGAAETQLQNLYGNSGTHFGNVENDIPWIQGQMAQRQALVNALQQKYGQTINVLPPTPQAPTSGPNLKMPVSGNVPGGS